MDASADDSKKTHRERRAGRKADRKKDKNNHVQDLTAQQRNPKAFAVQSIVKAQRNVARIEDIKSKKHHIPVVNRTPLQPPPILVAVVGGFKVGKSTLIRSLIRNYTRQKLSTIQGPVTVVAGKKQRLTFVEVKNDINCMVDIAKVADVVLMLIDITLGIEMEIFEFLEICRSYGSPRVMGILNHLDLMKENKSLRKKKKDLTHRFQVELYPGAKLFYLSGLLHGEYFRNEISNLGRFISILKFRPLQFRSTHPYVLVDRMEDITNAEDVRLNPVCERTVVLYGYVRGIPMKQNQNIHIPGVGDFRIRETSLLEDPCPLPGTLKKRSLNMKERLLYAPMSGVSGVVYDKDAIYIDLGGSHHGRRKEGDEEEDEEGGGGERGLMKSLLDMKKTSDEKTRESQFRLFSHSLPRTDAGESEGEGESEGDSEGEGDPSVTGQPKFESVRDGEGRLRRTVVFNEEEERARESGIESDGGVSEDGGGGEMEEEEQMEEEEKDVEDYWNVNEVPLRKKARTSTSTVGMEESSEFMRFREALQIQKGRPRCLPLFQLQQIYFPATPGPFKRFPSLPAPPILIIGR